MNNIELFHLSNSADSAFDERLQKIYIFRKLLTTFFRSAESTFVVDSLMYFV